MVTDQRAAVPVTFLAAGAELTGEPEAGETAEVRWVTSPDARAMIASG